MQIKNSVALVTGGASGLGAACVKRLVDTGANVVIADLDTKAQRSLETELGNRVRFVTTDVTNEQHVKKAVDMAWEAFGNLQIVVNCAGVGYPEKTVNKTGEPHQLSTFSKTIQINLIGTFNVTRLAAASMVTHRPNHTGERGVIINTASIAAYEGQVGQVAYAASKGGIVGMTLPLARDLSQYGIRVITIAPGIFDTPMLAGLSEAVRDSLAKQATYPPRLGRSEEFAALVQHIVENEMLNGEVIRLDAAMRMAAR